MDSILDFWCQMTANPLLFIASAIAIRNIFKGVNGSEWIQVVYGIFLSVIPGFGLGWIVCKLVTVLFYKDNRPKTEPFFRSA